MLKLMFICHGNICRSPMAEFIMKDMVQKHGIAGEFVISSCATSTEEIWNGIGNPVYPEAVEELKSTDFPAEESARYNSKRATMLSMTFFVCMDSANVRNAIRILGNDSEDKVHKLMEYTDRGGDVADPWYSNRFDVAYRDIYDGCEGLLEYLVSK